MDHVAIAFGLGATFLWADPIYDLTIDAFRAIAVRNYGRDALLAFEWAYWLFIHVVVFATTRMTVRWALMMLIAVGSYRLALSH